MKLVGICYMVTNRCNLSCRFCYAYKEDFAVSTSTMRNVIRTIAKLGVRKIHFTGGEPLLISEIAKLADYARNNGMKTAMSTNGVLLDDVLIDRLLPVLDEIALPLDGVTDDMISIHRGKGNSFDWMRGRISKLVDANICLEVATVATRWNVKSFCKIGDILLDHGVKKWKVFRYCEGRGKRRDEFFSISDVEFESLRNRLTSYSQKLRIDFRDANKEIMMSYLTVLAGGEMVMLKGGVHEIVGNILDECDVVAVLKQNEFNFAAHCDRHWSD